MSSTQPTTALLNIPTSQALFAQAREILPGGVNSPVRAFRAVGGQPIFIERGEGAYLVDVDGNRYIDYIMSWGPLILGHAHPDVVAALQEALVRGTSYGAPCPQEIELAQLVHGADAQHRDDALCQFRHGSDHERAAPGTRLYRSQQNHQV